MDSVLVKQGTPILLKEYVSSTNTENKDEQTANNAVNLWGPYLKPTLTQHMHIYGIVPENDSSHDPHDLQQMEPFNKLFITLVKFRQQQHVVSEV